jgi:hypothetical protein
LIFEWLTFHVASLVVVALLFGAMACLGGLITPLVIKYMEPEAAMAFLERLFPVYCRTGAIIAILAAAPLLPARSYELEMGILLGVSAAFLVAARYGKPRGPSALLHLIQFAGVGVVLVRLAQ